MAIFEPHLQIGGYELLRLLGEGGMGEVWLAQDRRADRHVALKFIKPHLLADPGFRTRFSNEAKTLGKLEHDRIVTLYAVLDEGEYLALVLRFIDGNSLADKIDAQGALALPFVLSCARDILPALGFAHENGIIHRDIKPPNILVDSRDRCFLMDFGIAVAEFAERGTMTGLAIGTPHYMSPEQIRTPREITIPLRGHRTDIYSFGVVLFEMLSGQVPFGQHSGVEDMFSIQSAHCNEPPPPLREINPTVPRAVEEVVMACLEKDPANRPQTCIELLGQLEAAALSGGQSVRAHPPTIVESRKSAAAEPKAAMPAPMAAAARRKLPQQVWYGLGAVAIAGGIGYSVMNRPGHVESVVTPPPHTVPAKPQPHTDTKPNRSSGAGTVTSGGGTALPPDHREIAIRGLQPQPPAAAGPTPEQLQAQRDYVAGQSLFAQGNYCESKAKADDAVNLFPKPEYVKLQRNATDGCNLQ